MIEVMQIHLPTPQSRLSGEDVNNHTPKLIAAAVLLVFLTLIFGGAIGYMIGTGKLKKETLTTLVIPPGLIPSPTITTPNGAAGSINPASTPTPTLTANALSNLSKSFSSTYDYYFRYPTTWGLTTPENTDAKILEYLVLNPKGSEGGLAITVSYTTRTYQEALALNSQPAEGIVVGNVTSSRKVLKNSDGLISVQVIIPDGTNTIIFLATETQKNTLNDILSTFKLIN